MKKTKTPPADELRSEYERTDFGVMVRGKYAKRLQQRSNVVVHDPRVAELFPNPASVNSALLSLARVAKRSAALEAHPSRPRGRRLRAN